MPPPPLPSVSLLIFLLLWQLGWRGFTVAPPSLPCTCFAASLSFCTVGNTCFFVYGRGHGVQTPFRSTSTVGQRVPCWGKLLLVTSRSCSPSRCRKSLSYG